jgi:tetratricopeptide (TPR) repeat protein
MRKTIIIKNLLISSSLCCLLACSPLSAIKISESKLSTTKNSRAEQWNQQGITLRQQGKFIQAEQAYQQAIALDANYADAWINLGILYELYRPNIEQARQAYEKFQSLQSTPDKEVAAWLKALPKPVVKSEIQPAMPTQSAMPTQPASAAEAP